MKKFFLTMIICSLLLTACGEGVQEHQTYITYIDNPMNAIGNYRVVKKTTPFIGFTKAKTLYYDVPYVTNNPITNAQLGIKAGYPISIIGNVDFADGLKWNYCDKEQSRWVEVKVGNDICYTRLEKNSNITPDEKALNPLCIPYPVEYQLPEVIAEYLATHSKTDIDRSSNEYYDLLRSFENIEISMRGTFDTRNWQDEIHKTKYRLFLEEHHPDVLAKMLDTRDKENKKREEQRQKTLMAMAEQYQKEHPPKWTYNGKEYDTKAEADAAMQADSIAESKREKEAELKFYADHGYADWNDYVKHNSTEVVVRTWSYDEDILYPAHYTDGSDSLVNHKSEWEEVEITVTGEYKHGLKLTDVRCTHFESHKIY